MSVAAVASMSTAAAAMSAAAAAMSRVLSGLLHAGLSACERCALRGSGSLWLQSNPSVTEAAAAHTAAW